MIKKVPILFLVVLPLFGYSQIDGFEFHRDDLNGYRQINSTQINYYDNGDSATSKGIYSLNDFGDIVKAEYFRNDSLDLWIRYEHDNSGRMILEEIHSEIYTYDENSDQHVPVWRRDYYNGSEYLYSNNNLIERRWFNCVEGNRSINIIEKYIYDELGKLVKTETYDLTTGIQGTFLPNTATIDSIFNKTSETLTISRYSYDNNSITETKIDESGDVSGFMLTKLNSDKLPIEILEQDSKHNPIMQYKLQYNENNDLVERERTIIDISKVMYDITIEDHYKIIYNNEDLPAISLTYSEGQLISKRILEYE